MHFANLAHVNNGIINGIWNILPLFTSILDYFMYGVTLNRRHVMGIIALILSAVLISVAGMSSG